MSLGIDEWLGATDAQRAAELSSYARSLARRGMVLTARGAELPKLALSFAFIPGGEHDLGITPAERSALASAAESEEDRELMQSALASMAPARPVRLPSFFMATTPLLVEQAAALGVALADDAERPYFGERGSPQHLTLSEAEQALGQTGLRLCTAAEWEYAVRAGDHHRWLVGAPQVDLDLDALEAAMDALYQDCRYLPDDPRSNVLGIWGAAFGDWATEAGRPACGAGGAGSSFPWQSSAEIVGLHPAFRDRAAAPEITHGVRLVFAPGDERLD